MSRQQLKDWRPNLVQVIELHFMPKRTRALLTFIDDELAGRTMIVRDRSSRPPTPSPRGNQTARLAAAAVNDEFQRELRELSDKHIFQWATRYQDCLFRYFDLYVAQLEVNP